MEIQESMRPADSDEEIADDSSLIWACSGAALVKATQSIETISSVFGEGPMEGVPCRLIVRLKEPELSFSLEKEELMSRGGPWMSRGLAGMFEAFVSEFLSSVWGLSVELSSVGETPSKTSPEPSSLGPSVSESYSKSIPFLDDFR